MGDVKILKDRNLEFVLVLDEFDQSKFFFFLLVFFKEVVVKDVVVGFYVLVKVGEVCFIEVYMFLI